MRTWVWLWLGLWGCESTVTRIGPGTASLPDDDDTAAPAGGWSCDKRAFDGTCDHLTGSGWDQLSAEQSCGDGVLVDSCPTPALGGCSRDESYPLAYVEWYYEGAFFGQSSITDLQSTCESNFGVWQQ